ncbi:hypothetical protein WA577_002870 [Blastocystis sp. JDR]
MKVLLAERIILNVLSFDLIVEQPYSTMMVLSQQLQLNEKALQAAWRFANDSTVTPVAIMYTEKTIAAACIYLAITGYNCIPLKDALPVLLTGSGADQTRFMNCVHTLKALYPDFDHLFHLCVCFSDLCG